MLACVKLFARHHTRASQVRRVPAHACWPRRSGAREKDGFMTSLGGSPENSSYKGYGLSVMVNILGACLSGSTPITDPMHTKKPQGNDIGHCCIAIDPGLFRDHEEFTADVTRLCDDLWATKPVDPASRSWWRAIRSGGMRQSACRRGSRSAPAS
jgi:LDH2 family malate/lactate/ureidoglycolate dehydrogenase